MPDSGIGLQVAIILLLIVANGVFAMSEIAVVSSRKSRLKARADAGDARARRALELAEHPNRFLSTVQIGITLIGIFAGAYGGATVATVVADWLATRIPSVAAYSTEIALAGVVLIITYLSLVVGELVPKRIGLANPERIAGMIAGPMHTLSIIAAPLVALLSVSTDALLRITGIRKGNEPPVTDEEIAALLELGTKAGVFEEGEQDLVERVFWLADQRARALVTPRHRIAWLDINDAEDVWRATMTGHRHARFLVCDDSLDNVLGMVHVSDVLVRVMAGEPLDLRSLMSSPLYVPASVRALRLLATFRESGVHLAVVVDEYGGTEGLITLNDVLEVISGDLGAADESGFVRREDGSLLVDADLPMEDLRDALGLDERSDRHGSEYRTLGGFVVFRMGHLPKPGEYVVAFDHRFEVIDMDGTRVDKVLVTSGAARADDAAHADDSPGL